MKACPRLLLACLALSSSLMAAPPIKKEAPPVKKKAGPIIYAQPDLDETEVDERMEMLTRITYSNGLKPLGDMEVDEKSIQTILQNKKAATTLEKLNAPIVIHSLEGAAKHLSRDSVQRLNIDFDKQQVAIFVWKGSDKDLLRGHLRTFRGREAEFGYLQWNPSSGEKPEHQPGNTAKPDKAMPNQQLTRTKVFVMTKHAKMRVREMSVYLEGQKACRCR